MPGVQIPNRSDMNRMAINTQDNKKNQFNATNVLTKILLVIIILLLLSLPVLIIKFNIRGMGEKSRPLLENIPYVEKILPAKPDPNDPKYMNKEELIKNFIEYKEKYEQINQQAIALKQDLEKLTNIKENYEKFLEDQKKLEEEKMLLQQEKQQLEEDRDKFFEDVKNANKADFKTYYEKIDKEKAQKLYEDILKEEKVNKEIKEYVAYYENMDPENAAKIFDKISSSEMDLVVKILKYMNKEQAGEVLASMKTDIAAKVSDRLAEEYPISKP
ncbi:MAG: hypothetical protein PWP27_94 [Clostridiales bacterium]|jgi:flagellar motility protein MotE (MotC chaperone)|nr:hypothetical protein [Clostridiales bacterium]MDK2932284.1 hypothetical protein [Clostridiales bacterium]